MEENSPCAFIPINLYLEKLFNVYCNPNAIFLLEANQDKIDWLYLARNPDAIHLLEAKIKMNLSPNPNAISLLESTYDLHFVDFSPTFAPTCSPVSTILSQAGKERIISTKIIPFE